jgi:hypothetical protein
MTEQKPVEVGETVQFSIRGEVVDVFDNGDVLVECGTLREDFIIDRSDLGEMVRTADS